MGMSLDAEIMYGMVLFDGEETLINVPWRKSRDDEGEWDEDEEKEEVDFEDWIVEQLGLAPLDWSTYPDERYSYQGEPYEAYRARMKVLSDAWDELVGAKEYYAKKKELLADVPVEEDYGGTDGFHSIILRLKDAPEVSAYYSPKDFDPLLLWVPDSSVAATFLAQYGVTWEPKWLLVPSYG